MLVLDAALLLEEEEPHAASSAARPVNAEPARTVRRLIIADILFFFRVVVDALVVAGCHPAVTRGHHAVCPSLRVQRWLSYSYSRRERTQRNIPSQYPVTHPADVRCRRDVAKVMP